MPKFVIFFILLFMSPCLWAQDSVEDWIQLAKEVLPGGLYYSGSTVRNLADGKNFSGVIDLTVVTERLSPRELSRLIDKLPGKKRTGFLYRYEAKGLTHIESYPAGNWAQVRFGEKVYRLHFVETIEQARAIRSFNVDRVLVPISHSPSIVEWHKSIDPERGVKSWLDGEIKTSNWNRALADPLSWALQWAQLIVEQGKGARMSLNLPGPAMDYVIEAFAKKNEKLTSEQKLNLRKAFAHPQANQIFETLQKVDFFNKLILHSETQRMMFELRINPWVKTRAFGPSCRLLFLR